jgi:hypothetical protein
MRLGAMVLRSDRERKLYFKIWPAFFLLPAIETGERSSSRTISVHQIILPLSALR